MCNGSDQLYFRELYLTELFYSDNNGEIWCILEAGQKQQLVCTSMNGCLVYTKELLLFEVNKHVDQANWLNDSFGGCLATISFWFGGICDVTIIQLLFMKINNYGKANCQEDTSTLKWKVLCDSTKA